MPQALLLLNPKSQQGDVDISHGLAILREAGINIVQRKPRSSNELTELIGQHSHAVDRVIVGGGDGTLRTSLPGLIKSNLPLGIIPLGTANDLARTLGLPTDLVDACRIIAGENLRRIDVGEVNGKYFLNAANIGLGVEVARRLDGQVKKRLGILAYLYSALDAARVSRAFRADIQYEGQTKRLRAVQIAVGNSRFYGGGMCISEHAEIDDGRLDLYAVPAQSWHRLAMLVPALRTGRTARLKNVFSLQSAELHIHTSRPKTVTVDGEKATRTPAAFRIWPRALSIYTSPSYE